MGSYSYVNGVFVVTTDIRYGFKRFHKCNAQESHFVVNDDDNIPRFEIWQFISYATPVIQVVKDMKYDSWIVSCNDNPFGYSPSTSRQIIRWIRERAFPFSGYDLKEAFALAHNVTPDIATYWKNISPDIATYWYYDIDIKIMFNFHTASHFHNVWR